jgi:4-hydroxythreonine-4-phosphate dehydrogenase
VKRNDQGKILDDLPIIGITMGDPSGIGPEIIVKALADPEIYGICRPVVLGDPGALSANLKGLGGESICEISKPSDAKGRKGKIDLIAISRLRKKSRMPGNPTVEGGEAMVKYIIRAVEMARRGELAAIVNTILMVIPN